MHTNFKSNRSTFYCIMPHRLRCSQLSDYNEMTGGFNSQAKVALIVWVRV